MLVRTECAQNAHMFLFVGYLCYNMNAKCFSKYAVII